VRKIIFGRSWVDEGNEVIYRSHCHGDVKQNPENIPQFFFKRPGFGFGNVGLFGRAGIHGILFHQNGLPQG